MIAPEQLRSFPRDHVLVLAGGTQAERASAMYRVAQGRTDGSISKPANGDSVESHYPRLRTSRARDAV